MSNLELRMSYDMFLKNILAIKTLSDEIDDEWKLESNSQVEYNSYLKKKVIKKILCSLPHSNSQNLPKNTFESPKKILVFEYHITYSISYEVPLLCLNIWETDGRRLSMIEAWKYLDKNYVQDNMYSVLTQQDHPVLQQPFLVLHPCKTIEILENFMHTSKNPVISWLSAIGPAVNLHLCNKYEELTRN